MNGLITTYLTPICIMLRTISFAQITATQAGIAVQGIARDGNNTARVNANITLNVRIHAAGNDIVPQQNIAIETDAFGVFSFILDVNQNNYPAVANQGAELEIREGTTLISNEPLRFVPYAIAAANGVPTGAIMPYTGNSAPAGWALCDGAAIPPGIVGNALRALLAGNNTPNLIDRFIVGAGSTYNVGDTGGEDAVALTQAQMPTHNHGGSTVTINNNGDHNHNTVFGGASGLELGAVPQSVHLTSRYDPGSGAGDFRAILGGATQTPNISPTSNAGSHNHGATLNICLLYTSPSPRDLSTSRMPSSA